MGDEHRGGRSESSEKDGTPDDRSGGGGGDLGPGAVRPTIGQFCDSDGAKYWEEIDEGDEWGRQGESDSVGDLRFVDFTGNGAEVVPTEVVPQHGGESDGERGAGEVWFFQGRKMKSGFCDEEDEGGDDQDGEYCCRESDGADSFYIEIGDK